ncbi:MAG: sterol desaturase family protein [Rhodospirillales bacterium]|nr:sterol desaturase family protein [Rhodospirillales bacterium]
MTETLFSHETAIRLGFFFGILAVMALWEILAPRRGLSRSKAVRWTANLGIVALNTVLLRLIFPATAVGLAALAAERGWGLLSAIALPYELAVLCSVVLLDFAIYLQHVLFHAVPVLWRLHRMHHADQDFDVTTGARFHPIEIVLSMVLKLAVVVALGPPVLGVLIFEVLLNGTAMFNHANARLPLGADRVLRLLVVTPDMHRVHHSVTPEEANSNFGFNLPWWDRLLGTYRAQPAQGHEAMTIGIDQFREAADQQLHNMLVQPFRSGAGDYAINRRDWKRDEGR